MANTLLIGRIVLRHASGEVTTLLNTTAIICANLNRLRLEALAEATRPIFGLLWEVA